MNDVVTELVELVGQYHRRWVTVHGDHGPECELCAPLHARHVLVLWSLQHSPDEPLEVAA